MIIRKAMLQDITPIVYLYEDIHTEEERGNAVIGWKRGVYPVIATAAGGFDRGDLFALLEGDEVVASAIINKIQLPCYADGHWMFDAKEEDVMVLHTLVVSPKHKYSGYGTAFIRFYEQYAAEQGCHYLRLDTQEKNLRARKFYKKLGYTEVDVIDDASDFTDLPPVRLVLLEKHI